MGVCDLNHEQFRQCEPRCTKLKYCRRSNLPWDFEMSVCALAALTISERSSDTKADCMREADCVSRSLAWSRVHA